MAASLRSKARSEIIKKLCQHTVMQIKKASAECEDAWKGAGTKVGLQVWRIVKFKVFGLLAESFKHFNRNPRFIVCAVI